MLGRRQQRVLWQHTCVLFPRACTNQLCILFQRPEYSAVFYGYCKMYCEQIANTFSCINFSLSGEKCYKNILFPPFLLLLAVENH